MRTILGCTLDPTQPCLGYAGDCEALPAMFADVPGIRTDDPIKLMADYVCHQFPDENSQRDHVLTGLVQAAIAIPCSIVLELAFEKANEPWMEERWLSWAGLRRILAGPLSWHFSTRDAAGRLVPPSATARVVAGTEEMEQVVFNLLASLLAWVGGLFASRRSREQALAAAEREEEELVSQEGGENPIAADAERNRRYIEETLEREQAQNRKHMVAAALGVGFIYVAWFICAWYIFVYGANIHTRSQRPARHRQEYADSRRSPFQACLTVCGEGE